MAKKILIADDDAGIVKMLSLRLKARGYEVVGALDSLQAANIAHKEKPDLMILDIMMPAGGGDTLYENLQKSVRTLAVPVIFISALPNEKVKQILSRIGAENFIPKPFDPEEVVNKIKSLIGE